MILPDPLQLSQMLEDTQVLRSRLNHLSAAEIAQDLEELHRFLRLIRKHFGSVEGLVDHLRDR